MSRGHDRGGLSLSHPGGERKPRYPPQLSETADLSGHVEQDRTTGDQRIASVALCGRAEHPHQLVGPRTHIRNGEPRPPRAGAARSRTWDRGDGDDRPGTGRREVQVGSARPPWWWLNV